AHLLAVGSRRVNLLDKAAQGVVILVLPVRLRFSAVRPVFWLSHSRGLYPGFDIPYICHNKGGLNRGGPDSPTACGFGNMAGGRRAARRTVSFFPISDKKLGWDPKSRKPGSRQGWRRFRVRTMPIENRRSENPRSV